MLHGVSDAVSGATVSIHEDATDIGPETAPGLTSVVFLMPSWHTQSDPVRNVASAGFSHNQPIDLFWLEVEAFKNAGGLWCFPDLTIRFFFSFPLYPMLM